MNEIKPHTAELIAKMEAAWAKRGNPDYLILLPKKEVIEEHYGLEVADYIESGKSVTGTR